jgi:NAD(P)-dependent dehydrogenase (short-subunit alcohol dehydrogenase family)
VRFKNRVAVITGAGSGIGRATALAFVREGASVVAVDVNGDSLKELERESAQLVLTPGETVSNLDRSEGSAPVCIAIEGDIKDVETAKRASAAAVQNFGRLDYLFNNAGIEFISTMNETGDADWDAVMDTNLRGTFLMSRACCKIMADTGFGVIVNNASDAGIRGIKVNAAYSTSKAGIIHLTRSIALDYASSGIRANAICPGCIRTPLCERFNEEVGRRKGKSGKEVLDAFVKKNIPMLRVGEPEEVASAVLFLCSDDARYITGAVLPIDGGLTTGM